MRYDVIRCDSLDELIEKVNERLMSGWVNVGGVVIELTTYYDRDYEHDMTSVYYLQTMMQEQP